MVKDHKRSNNKRKINIFLIFLLCSFLAWLVSKLSESYTSTVSFNLTYVNAPDTLVFAGASFNEIDARLEANGFQLLRNNFYEKELKIDLSNLRNDQEGYYLTRTDYRKQLEKQVSGTMNLLELNGDTLFIKLYSISEKEVGIVPSVNLSPAQNYIIDGEIEVEPSVVTIKGPRDEINRISSISTEEIIREQLTDNFSIHTELIMPEELKNSVLSQNSIRISGKVYRFSEKVLEVPIVVINIPEGTEISTFPSSVSVLCKAKVDALKELVAADIPLIADFRERNMAESLLNLKIAELPEGVYDIQLLKTEVEFILKRP